MSAWVVFVLAGATITALWLLLSTLWDEHVHSDWWEQ